MEDDLRELRKENERLRRQVDDLKLEIKGIIGAVIVYTLIFIFQGCAR